MIGMGTSNRVALTNNMFSSPIASRYNVTNNGPAIAPAIAPTAITLNRRFACSLLYSPDMNVQNTDKWNRLNTLVQT